MRGRYSRRLFARKVGGIARRATGRILVKRFRLNGVSIPDVTSTDYDNPLKVDLVECVETMDEEAESDGSAIADVPLYSRFLSLKSVLGVTGNASTTLQFRWMVCKLPDGENLWTDLADSFHNSNDTPTGREQRKYCIAKGYFISNPSAAVNRVPLFIRRGAIARVGPMSEGDKISLIIAKDSAGTTGTMNGFGSLYFRANG